MSLSTADVAELRQLLASAVRGKGQIEVIELSHSAFTRPYYLAHQLKDDFQVTLETGETVEEGLPCELREETGLEVQVDELLYMTDRFKSLGHHVVDLCFRIHRIAGTPSSTGGTTKGFALNPAGGTAAN